MWGAVAERCINVGWTVVKGKGTWESNLGKGTWEKNLGGAPEDWIRSDWAGWETDRRGGHGKESDHHVLCILGCCSPEESNVLLSNTIKNPKRQHQYKLAYTA
ncbi:hypothetical protein XENTR_v10014254 [Xenopus tropicalis]|nr:hypothetical protein XENTR_v10014254 [Xenopus tropicalis]